MPLEPPAALPLVWEGCGVVPLLWGNAWPDAEEDEEAVEAGGYPKGAGGNPSAGTGTERAVDITLRRRCTFCCLPSGDSCTAGACEQAPPHGEGAFGVALGTAPPYRGCTAMGQPAECASVCRIAFACCWTGTQDSWSLCKGVGCCWYVQAQLMLGSTVCHCRAAVLGQTKKHQKWAQRQCCRAWSAEGMPSSSGSTSSSPSGPWGSQPGTRAAS